MTALSKRIVNAVEHIVGGNLSQCPKFVWCFPTFVLPYWGTFQLGEMPSVEIPPSKALV